MKFYKDRVPLPMPQMDLVQPAPHTLALGTSVRWSSIWHSGVSVGR